MGPGPWSDTAIIKAATVPSPPGKPYYIGSTASTITLGLPETIDNGGSKIRTYELYRDDGDLSSDINVQVTDYNGIDTEFEVTGLTPGSVYRFAYFAVNDFGSSESSLILTIASTELPEPPTDITIDWDRSTKTSLQILWNAPVVEPASLITGYYLEMDEGFLGS